MIGRAAAPLAALALAACIVADVDYVGKSCTATCPNDLRCIDSTCVRLDAAVYVTGLRPEWATPNAIRWGWTMQGAGTDLASYELVLSSDVPGAAGVKTWTSRDLAELGGYQLRRSDGFDVVSGTITYDLDPSTSYSAVVRVRDVYGRTYVSPTARASTDAPRSQHGAIFVGGTLAAGSFLLPGAPAFVVAPTGGVTNGPALDFRAALAPAVGFENLRVQGFDLGVDASLTPKLFATAYLEFWIRGTGAPTSAWSEIWLRLAPTAAETCADPATCAWSYRGAWVYHPDPSNPIYRRVQIPLSALTHRTGNPDPLTLADVARGFDEVSFGCPFLAATDQAQIDRIALFW